jgi:hypothetical protein
MFCQQVNFQMAKNRVDLVKLMTLSMFLQLQE